MNRCIRRIGLAALYLAWAAPLSASPGVQTEPGAADTTRPSPEVAKMVENIHWLGHDSFRLEGEGKVIYLDPYQLPAGAVPADLILITHDHSDHCSPADVERIRTPETVVVTVAAAAAKLPKPVRLVSPGDSLVAQGIAVETVPAYNTNKFRSPGKPFHPREAGNVGYVVTLAGRRIYHTGDTDLIPEMGTVRADVALLPVSGIYVMTVEEAVEAADLIRPQVAVPMHVGAGIGELDDARRFAQTARVPVRVLPIAAR